MSILTIFFYRVHSHTHIHIIAVQLIKLFAKILYVICKMCIAENEISDVSKVPKSEQMLFFKDIEKVISKLCC